MIRIRQIEVGILKEQNEEIEKKVCQLLKVKKQDILDMQIVKQSIDARDKKKICYVYEVLVEVKGEDLILKKNRNVNILKDNQVKYHLPEKGNKKLENRVVIVGSGPAGLFAAYILAESGYSPLIIERGEKIEERVKAVQEFWEKGILNENSNVQFGEGGAGTFSDGKLNTLVKDRLGRQRRVLEIFVECGAPAEILYSNKPHIGTDILRKVIIAMREKIMALGGEFRYQTCLTDLDIQNGCIRGIEVNHKEYLPVSVLLLALGHSARDTFQLLEEKGLQLSSKPFAVGVRIEHLQEMINQAQYGEMSKYLEPANYKLTYRAKNGRGVYTFCMCPGGYVVNASSEKERLVVNGMSNYKRESMNANSAIIVTVGAKDFGDAPLAGVDFQRDLEEKAYQIGKGKIPVQRYVDFKNNKCSTKIGKITPITKGDYQLSNLRNIFPSDICESLIEAIEYFDTKIKGFACSDALLLAVEARTSSPVRIERNEFGESNILGIYPCGEGAGYAGGIMSSAVDGIIQTENIIRLYCNIEKISDIS